jgi:hypothetical protein
MWTYHQISGAMVRPDGTLAANGYSGHDEGKDDPNFQSVHDKGPCPQGGWRMEIIKGDDGEPCDYEGKAKPVIRLHPKSSTNTFSRSGFLCHGDSVHEPGSASLGCIVMPHNIRTEMAQSIEMGDEDLDVVA